MPNSPFITDIDQANSLISDWSQIARAVAAHCRHRRLGLCLKDCRGLAVCDCAGLTFIQPGYENRASLIDQFVWEFIKNDPEAVALFIVDLMRQLARLEQ